MEPGRCKMKERAGYSIYKGLSLNLVRNPAALLGIFFFVWLAATVHAGDPFQKPQSESIRFDEQEGLAFDQVNWKRPQGVFSWITLARGYNIPWDSFGRQGWMSDDAYVEPVDPGVTEFSPDTQEIFIVFEGQPLDAPGQFAAAWYPMAEGKLQGEEPLGKDVLELEMNQRYGYFILSPSNQKWEIGNYLVTVYYGSPGQELHDTNIVGTLEFTIKE